jgi:hypothetical protein
MLEFASAILCLALYVRLAVSVGLTIDAAGRPTISDVEVEPYACQPIVEAHPEVKPGAM